MVKHSNFTVVFTSRVSGMVFWSVRLMLGLGQFALYVKSSANLIQDSGTSLKGLPKLGTGTQLRNSKIQPRPNLGTPGPFKSSNNFQRFKNIQKFPKIQKHLDTHTLKTKWIF